jgi:hypothetical protein
VIGVMAASCATAPSHWGSRDAHRAGTTDAVLAKGNAIVVISTSSDWACEENSSFVQLRRAGERTERGFVPLNGAFRSSDFPDHLGFLDAFVVQPGTYEIRIEPEESTWRFVSPIVARFQIEAGTVKYVGNVHGRGCFEFVFGVEDVWADVRPKFAEQFPGVATDRVVIEPIFLPGERPAYDFERRQTLRDPSAPTRARYPLAPAPALRAPSVPPVP